MSDTPPRGFPEAEFAQRTAMAQELMARQNLSGLLLMSEAEVRYFSGFQTLFWQSPTRPWFLFVPYEGKPIAVIPDIGAALMRKTWIDDIRTWSAPAPDDDGVSALSELLSDFIHPDKSIGVMKGHETTLRMPLTDYERLIDGLPGLKIKDATPLVRKLRMVKSSAEIEKLAHICAIGSKVFSKVSKFASETVPLEEVFRAFRLEALLQGADDIPYLVGGASPGGYDDVISPPTTRPLQCGDVLMLDTGATWDGYFCDFDRNYSVGQADDLSCRAYDVLWRATEIGIATAKPGVTCRELYLAMQSVIAEMNNNSGDIGRFGHGLGMQLTEWPSLAPFDETVIEENMVLTIEPSLNYGDGRIMVHEENIVVRAQGAQLLTSRAPRELQII